MRTRLLILIGLIIGISTFVSLSGSNTVMAEPFCQCVDYVRNRFSLSGSGDAYTWDDGKLQANGYSKVNPKVGTIVVMERNFPTANTSAGHIGVVESYDSITGRIVVRGANQGSTNLITEHGCNNVNLWAISTSVNGRTDISFWEKQQGQGSVKIEVRDGSNQLMPAEIGLSDVNGQNYGVSSGTGIYTVNNISAGTAKISARNGTLYAEQNVTVVANITNNYTIYLGNQCTRDAGQITTQSCPVGNDNALFVSDVTIPDGQVMPPNNQFTKTWRIKNSGSSTWNTGYKIVFQSGHSMGAQSERTIPNSVAPGASIDISVNMTAPGSAGTYRGNWKMKNASGVAFGDLVWVEILVQGNEGPTQRVKLYNYSNYENQVGEYNIGRTQHPDRNSKSMLIPNGWSVITYRGNNYDGMSLCWNRSIANLEDFSDWQYKTDSLEVFNYNVCPAPRGRMTSPAQSTTQYGPTIKIAASASNEHNGIQKIEFYAWSNDSWSNQQWIYLGSDNSQPYEYDWNVSNLGTQTGAFVTLKVYDNTGNGSALIWDPDWTHFNISNITKPAAPSLSSPADSHVFNVNDSRSFAWNSSSSATEYFLEITGGTLTTAYNGSGWGNYTSVTVPSATLVPTAQTYFWRVKARNGAGESGWSAARSFKVGNPDTTPPTGNITSPAKDSTQQGPVVKLTANLTDDRSGIIKAEFFAWSGDAWSNQQWIYLGNDADGLAPYEFNWNVSGLGNQTYAYVTVAGIDGAGNYSGPLTGDAYWSNFSINNVVAPADTPVLTLPVDNAVIPFGSVVDLTWTATGTEYYGEVSGPAGSTFGWQAPITRSLGSLPSGTYSWKIKAKNTGGESGWSAARTFTVQEPVVVTDCNSETSTTSIKLFADQSCRGAAFDAGIGFVNLTNFDNNTESIYIPSGKSARIWAGANKSGSTRCVNGSMWNLNVDKYDDGTYVSTNGTSTVSSAETFTNMSCTPPVVITGCNAISFTGIGLYLGTNCTSTEKKFTNAAFTALIAPFNNKAKSIYIKSGWSVRIFDNKDKTGGKACINSTKADLTGLKYKNGALILVNGNSTISAVKVFTNGSCLITGASAAEITDDLL